MKHFYEIDWLKSVGILSVILIHSIHNRVFDAEPGLESLLGFVTRFAVPGFLFASGFLFYQHNAHSSASSWTLIKKFSKRLLPAYLICSIVALVFGPHVPWNPSSYSVPWNEIPEVLLLGYSVGVYYFVFVILYLYLISLFVRHLSSKAVYGILGLSAVAVVVFYLKPYGLPEDPYWFNMVLFRHPALHLFPYFLGWVVSMHYEEIRTHIKRYAWQYVVGIFGINVIMIMAGLKYVSFTEQGILALVYIYLTLGLLWIIGTHWKPADNLRYLSRYSYEIYLIHIPFVRQVQLWCYDWDLPTFWRIAVTWAVGGGLCITCVLILQEIFKSSKPATSTS